MLKKIFSSLAVILGLSLNAEAAETIRKLPSPDVKGGIPLMEAIHARKSNKEFSAKKIDGQTLSEILYAAWGVSHEGKRTVPTSMNKQNLQVYAVMPDGVWLYDGVNNSIKQVSSQDVRSYLTTQDYAKDAQLFLVYTGTDRENSPLHAGSAYQNVSLYATSRGMNNVVRAYVDKKGLAKALNLDAEDIIITQVVGWPYM